VETPTEVSYDLTIIPLQADQIIITFFPDPATEADVTVSGLTLDVCWHPATTEPTPETSPSTVPTTLPVCVDEGVEYPVRTGVCLRYLGPALVVRALLPNSCSKLYITVSDIYVQMNDTINYQQSISFTYHRAKCDTQ
jgi:hypothetical protein